MRSVVIVDYGMGNLHGVGRRLNRIGAVATVSASPAEVAAAEKLVLPGVGHFGMAMERLRESGLRTVLDEAVLRRETPILGICLGMQLLAARSEEGDAEGLGWIDADVVRFRVKDPLRFKVPQMGWNTIAPRRVHSLLVGLKESPEFYFAHAYHLVCRDPSDVVAETDYEGGFPSIVVRRNVYGVQFHPEKSHDAGDTLLRNFAAL